MAKKKATATGSRKTTAGAAHAAGARSARQGAAAGAKGKGRRQSRATSRVAARRKQKIRKRVCRLGTAAADGAAACGDRSAAALPGRRKLCAGASGRGAPRRPTWRWAMRTCAGPALRGCAWRTFRRPGSSGEALDDYADYLGAQAAFRANRGADAYSLLEHFAERYPDSIFVPNAPVLLANAHLQQGDGQGALAVLQPLTGTPHGDARGLPLCAGAGVPGERATRRRRRRLYREIYVKQPLSSEAVQARQQLQAMGDAADCGGAEAARGRAVQREALHGGERGVPGDREERLASLCAGGRDALAIYAAVCDLKLKHLSRREVERLPETGDDSAALKLYMLPS